VKGLKARNRPEYNFACFLYAGIPFSLYYFLSTRFIQLHLSTTQTHERTVFIRTKHNLLLFCPNKYSVLLNLLCVRILFQNAKTFLFQIFFSTFSQAFTSFATICVTELIRERGVTHSAVYPPALQILQTKFHLDRLGGSSVKSWHSVNCRRQTGRDSSLFKIYKRVTKRRNNLKDTLRSERI